MFCLFFVVVFVFKNVEVGYVMVVLFLFFVVESFFLILSSLFCCEMRFDMLGKRNVGVVLCIGVIVIILVILGFGVWFIIGVSIIGLVICLVVFYVVSEYWLRLEFEIKYIWECLRFGMKLIGVLILNYFSNNIDKIFFGMMFGVIMLGVYLLVKKLV